MAVSAFATGTQTAVVTTEHTLSDVNVPGTYSLSVDMVNLAANDVVELRCYEMVLTGGTQRVLLYAAFYGVQPTHDIIKVSIPIGNDLSDATSLRFTLKQTFGVGRDFYWKVLKYM